MKTFRWAPGLVKLMARRVSGVLHVSRDDRGSSYLQVGAALDGLSYYFKGDLVPSGALCSAFLDAYHVEWMRHSGYGTDAQAVRSAVLAGLRAAKRAGSLPEGCAVEGSRRAA
jgi:hypothetical protein